MSTDITTRALCLSAKAYGVLAAAYIREEDRPKNFYRNSHFNIPGSLRGGSGIVNPNGEYITGPVYDQETIVYGDVDLAEIDRSRTAVNITGIYSRWDLLNLKVRQEPYEPVVDMEEAEVMFSGLRQVKDLEEKIKQHI